MFVRKSFKVTPKSTRVDTEDGAVVKLVYITSCVKVSIIYCEFKSQGLIEIKGNNVRVSNSDHYLFNKFMERYKKIISFFTYVKKTSFLLK